MQASDAVKRVARAIFESHNATYTPVRWENDPEHWRRYARAAIAAMPETASLLAAIAPSADVVELRGHRDFWLKSWSETQDAASALVARIDRLAERECGTFDILNCIANSSEMDALRAALSTETKPEGA